MALLTETLARPLADSINTNACQWIESIAEGMQALDEAVIEYDPVSRIEAIEHDSRDGFWSWNSGGYEVCLPASLYSAWSSGQCPAPVASIIRSGNTMIADEWKRQHPGRPEFDECVCAGAGDPGYEWQEAAQEWEQEGWQSDDDCYYWKARVIYYAAGAIGNTSGQDEVYLDAYLCSDSYGRDTISWLACYPGGKADQTAGNFKLTLPVDKFAALHPDQIARMVKTAMRKLPPFLNCG
jgi:hypothetical protein